MLFHIKHCFKKILFSTVFLFCLVLMQPLHAQVDYVVKGINDTFIKNLRVLIDKDYSIHQIVADSSLKFDATAKINVKGQHYYWIQLTIKNPLQFDKQLLIATNPYYRDTLFYYNELNHQWKNTVAGFEIANTLYNSSMLPITINRQMERTVYIKVNVSKINWCTTPLKNVISIYDASDMQQSHQFKFTLWMVTILLLAFLFIYNLYLYFMFKDITYIYYLYIQLGSFLYVATLRNGLNYLSDFRFVTGFINNNGISYYFSASATVNQIGIWILFFGFVQYTRSYLNIKLFAKVWDKILQFSLLLLLLFGMVATLSIVKGWTHNYMLIFTIENIQAIAMVVVMMGAGIACLRKNNKPARYYLMAQSLPLLLIFVMVICLLKLDNSFGKFSIMLPNIAILVQGLTLAIALVARVNIIKDELVERKLANQLQQQQNNQLAAQIEHDKKEIASALVIKDLMKELHHRVKNNLQIVSSLLSLQSFRIKDKIASDAIKEGQHRIEAMSMIHQRLYATDNINEVNIKEYVTDLAESLLLAYGFAKDKFDLKLDIENEMMNVDKAIPLSLIINELVTNSFKYAFDNTAQPQLTITLTKEKSLVQLMIADNGKGLDMKHWQTNKGYGKELVNTLTKQLDGTIEVFVKNGTIFQLTFPNYISQNI